MSNIELNEGEVAMFSSRGFGFIRSGGNGDLYFHVTACRPEGYEPQSGDFVRFSVGVDRNGRPAAQAVYPIGSMVPR